MQLHLLWWRFSWLSVWVFSLLVSPLQAQGKARMEICRTPLWSLHNGRSILEMEGSADGQRLLTCDSSGRVRLWHLERRRLLGETRMGFPAGALFSPQGHWVAIWGPSRQRLLGDDLGIYDGHTLQPLQPCLWQSEEPVDVFSTRRNAGSWLSVIGGSLDLGMSYVSGRPRTGN